MEKGQIKKPAKVIYTETVKIYIAKDYILLPLSKSLWVAEKMTLSSKWADCELDFLHPFREGPH